MWASVFSTIDSNLVISLNHLANQSQVLQFLTGFCSTYLIYLTILIAIVYLIFDFPLKNGQRIRPILGYATVSVLLAFAIGYIIETAVGRARPYTSLSDIQTIGYLPKNSSMPSLHTLAVFAFAFAFAFWRPKVANVGWLILAAIFVAISRVTAGLHYPSDVFVGAAIGVISAYLVVYEGSPVFKWLFRNRKTENG